MEPLGNDSFRRRSPTCENPGPEAKMVNSTQLITEEVCFGGGGGCRVPRGVPAREVLFAALV